MPNSLDRWQKAEIISRMFSILVIPLAIAVAGAQVNDALQDRELRARYVELAIDILAKDLKTGDQEISDRALRQWAVQVLTKYAPAEAPLDENVQLALRRYALEIPGRPTNIRLE